MQKNPSLCLSLLNFTTHLTPHGHVILAKFFCLTQIPASLRALRIGIKKRVPLQNAKQTVWSRSSWFDQQPLCESVSHYPREDREIPSSEREEILPSFKGVLKGTKSFTTQIKEFSSLWLDREQCPTHSDPCKPKNGRLSLTPY